MNEVIHESRESGNPEKKSAGIGMPASVYLQNFGDILSAAFDGEVAYQVGSSLEGKTWRDVDVRIMLNDDVYEKMGFGDPARPHDNEKWCAYVLAFSELGRRMTGLPIDFQIQQTTYANEKFSRKGGDRRNALIMGSYRRQLRKEQAECRGNVHSEPVVHHEDALDRLNSDLEREVASELDPQPVKNFGDTSVPSFVHPGEAAQDKLAMHGHVDDPGPKGPKGEPGGNPPFDPTAYKLNLFPQGDVRGRNKEAAILDEANWRPTTNTVYDCVCGGHVSFKQMAPEGLFVCDECDRWYNCESEVEQALRNKKANEASPQPVSVGFILEGKKLQSDRLIMTGKDLRYLAPVKFKEYTLFMEMKTCPDVQIKDDDKVAVTGQTFYLVPAATFGSTGTIAHGVPQTTGVTYLLNGQETQFAYTAENKACISYEEIVVRTMAQEKKINSEELVTWLSRNAEHPLWAKTLPNYTVVYKYDSVPPSGILRGSVFKGERLYVAPGLRITAMLTGNA